MENPTPRKIRHRRVFGFIVVLVAMVYGTTELAAWVAYRLAFSVPFSFKRVQRERTRFIPRDMPPQERPAHLNMAALHPYLGFVVDPDLANRAQPGHFSSQGFPQLDPPIQKRSPGKLIVGILGGSVATHFSEHGVETLRREMGSSGRFSGKELVFVNLANGGYKQPQQLITLNYFLAQGAEFDILINLDGFNEIALHPRFNAETGVFHLYPVNWRGLANVPDADERALIAATAVRRHDQRMLAKQFSRVPLRFSITANFLWKWMDRRLESSIADYQSSILARREQGTYQQVGPRAIGPLDETDSELVAVWKRCSLQLDRLCRANGVRYYHFLQPNQYVPGSKEMNAEEKQQAFLDNHVMKTSVENGYPRLSRAGKELSDQGVRFHDLTMIFADHAEPIYYDTCCHINQRGNEILAGQIARVIMATREPPQAPGLAN